jgi:hypothetical protein
MTTEMFVKKPTRESDKKQSLRSHVQNMSPQPSSPKRRSILTPRQNVMKNENGILSLRSKIMGSSSKVLTLRFGNSCHYEEFIDSISHDPSVIIAGNTPIPSGKKPRSIETKSMVILFNSSDIGAIKKWNRSRSVDKVVIIDDSIFAITKQVIEVSSWSNIKTIFDDEYD